jgi:hypothetical protein
VVLTLPRHVNPVDPAVRRWLVALCLAMMRHGDEPRQALWGPQRRLLGGCAALIESGRLGGSVVHFGGVARFVLWDEPTEAQALELAAELAAAEQDA